LIRARIVGTGAYLPAKVVSNAELAQTVDTSDQWIVERTGIRQRHIAADGELTSDLATAAARVALHEADLAAEALDLIVVATSTPDHTFPACATAVQRKLGALRAAAFDVQAGQITKLYLTHPRFHCKLLILRWGVAPEFFFRDGQSS
jgi:3-oxoacyl-[acyl-carrier-protein] synthase-3